MTFYKKGLHKSERFKGRHKYVNPNKSIFTLYRKHETMQVWWTTLINHAWFWLNYLHRHIFNQYQSRIAKLLSYKLSYVGKWSS